LSALRVTRVGPEAAADVVRLVDLLLAELGEEGDETGSLDVRKMKVAWALREERHCAFLAYDDDGAAVGVATLSTSFALYAQGDYGIINEMWVAPEHRSAGVGAALIDAVMDYGRARGWARIDVTAPESERWDRTRKFYEDCGFAFTGPKLKILL
jgi:GNAT superfamily N-acetyltransferase